jgi:hypothetical protein
MTARNQQKEVTESSSVLVDLDTVLKYVLPFLSPHGYDLLNLRLTSRGILNAMEDPSAPEIPQVLVLRQERIPTMMKISNFGQIDEVSRHNFVIGVAQLQVFRLLVFHKEGEEIENQSTTSKGWIRNVTVRLQNGVGPSDAEDPTSRMVARPTYLDYQIETKPNKHQQPHGCGRLHFLAFFYEDNCRDPNCDCFRVTVGMLRDGPSAERGRFSNSSEGAPAHRLAMSCLYECAKRIARFPDETPYPSENFLMKRLPSALYPYFPKEFDFNAPDVDRETTIEFIHLPAFGAGRRAQEWREYFPTEANEVRVYDLNELP